jgi:predicted DNA-binding transcriptional regulator AlpA
MSNTCKKFLHQFQDEPRPTSIRREQRIQPRLLSRGEAAYYAGVGVTLFDGLVQQGLMPRAKAIGARRVGWDILELDKAIDELPEAGPQGQFGPSTLDPYQDVRA